MTVDWLTVAYGAVLVIGAMTIVAVLRVGQP